MSTIDTGFLKPFVIGAIRTLKDFCGIDATLQSLGPSAESAQHQVDIAGVIGITGKAFRGAMTISFEKRTFLAIMNKMLNENYTELTSELEDGAAELSNVIFGQAKSALNQAGHQIKMAIPSVMKGEQLESGCPTSTKGDLVILTTSDGPIYIEFAGESETVQAPTNVGPIRDGSAPKLDAHVLMSFVDGIRKTLQTQCNATATAGSPFFKKPESDFSFDVGGIVGFTGAAFGGTLSICFEEKVFLKIVENLTGEKHASVSKDIEDAAAELVSIVFGTSKAILNSEGYALRGAIPTIVRGKKVHSLYPAQRPPIVLPFQLFEGMFWVEFAFENIKH